MGTVARKVVLLAGLLSVIAGCGSGSSSGSDDTHTATNGSATLQSIEVSATNTQAALGTSAQLTATAIYPPSAMRRARTDG